MDEEVTLAPRHAKQRDAEADIMPEIIRSAKLYQERKLQIPTLRTPQQKIFLHDNLVNKLPLEPQQVNPKYIFKDKAGDGGKTEIWPHTEWK